MFPSHQHNPMRNTVLAVLCIIAITNAHMWIFSPDRNRFGPNGGSSGLSNKGNGNPGHDAARSGSATSSPCSNVAYNANNAKKLTAPTTVMFLNIFRYLFLLFSENFSNWVNVLMCDMYFINSRLVQLRVGSNRRW